MTIYNVFNGQPFTAAMAEKAGLSRATLRHLERSGVIRAVLFGVYVAASTSDSIPLRARAASLLLPDHAVLCDRTAAYLYGIDVLEPGELDVVPRVEVVSVDGQERSRRSGVHGGERDLLPSEITVVHGVRVTSPLRTACDLACLRGRYRALGTLDAFRRKFKFSQRDLEQLLPRFARRRGVTQLRELIPLTTDGSDSPPESWIRLMIHDHGLPMPEPQVWVTAPDGSRRRLENAYPHLRVAVEYDSDAWHSSDEQHEHDDARRGQLDDGLDWVILAIRKEDLNARSRELWLAELDEVIAARTGTRPKRLYARGPDHPSYQWRRRTRR